jgi:medium-chain acyl-[acyl-carrier-protein] hydrolase
MTLAQLNRRPRGAPFIRFRCRQTPQVRLFCFHHAGGNSTVFRDWPSKLDGRVEVLGVQLPGHVGRYSEPLIKNINELVSQLYSDLSPFFDGPFCFFGHSMGALLAYEIACLLEQRSQRIPEHLVISAKRAPHLERIEQRNSDLPLPLLIEKLREFAGTPEEVLQDARLVELLVPIWRADFAVGEDYKYRFRPPLSCPLTAVGGASDSSVSTQDVAAWAQFTRSRFELQIVEGGHMFLSDSPGRAELLMILDRTTSLARGNTQRP